MKKATHILMISLLIFTFIGGSFQSAKADEGMWLPFLVNRLNYTDMQKHGLKLTAEEIYSVNNSSLKDAIIQFGNGCTGEIISDQGLILTNHHCGFGKIQEHSSIEHDYLTDGFWAFSKDQELANPGFFVKFLIRIEDVSKEVLANLNDKMTETERSKAIADVTKKLTDKANENGKYDVVIKPFFNGNEFYMFVMQTYRDVRLVGAPPSSIGKFGGDTDNWMWPRHTGDFSMFRVYTAPDGSPADYSKDNVPMKPKHHLPISLEGVKNGDFAMIMGYPGSTDRYLTSFGVEQNLKLVYPTRIKIRRAKLDIYAANMDADAKVRIQYASKYAGVANYWKNFIGMSRGLNRLDVADKKRETEAKLAQWIDADDSRKAKYGTAMSDIQTAYQNMDAYVTSRYYFIEAIYSGSEAIKNALGFKSLMKELEAENPDNDKINKITASLKASSVGFFKDFDLTTDKQVWAKMMQLYHQDVPMDQQPSYLIDIDKKYKGNYAAWAEQVYAKSIFVSQAKLDAFLANPSIKVLAKDPVYVAMNAFFDQFEVVRAKSSSASDQLNKGNRLFIDALRQMETDKTFYPDANFTMRLTYGNVKDYYPQDAVHYNYFTTLQGVMDKEDPTNPEFVVEPKLKEIFQKKDYGVYGEGETMKVCFLSNNDITGGNSGSPVINGKGQLIGLAFDGNWEAMSGDIAFEPELQRTISVDIRYVLLIIDRYAGAKNLIDELTLVNRVIE
jgi:hypothetical protein